MDKSSKKAAGKDFIKKHPVGFALVLLFTVYIILSVIFWFTGMPEMFLKYSVREDNTVCIEYYSGFFPLLKIPDKIDGMPVTEIGWSIYNYTYYKDGEFRSKYNFLTGLVIAAHLPDSVESIDDSAFIYFDNLCFINIPTNLRSTGYRIFSDTRISELIFPEGITEIGVDYSDGINIILFPEQAFAEMPYLSRVVLPDSLKKIGDNAFRNCKRLKKVTLPDGIEEIGFAAFQSSGLEEINIPESLTDIGGCIFRYTPYEEKLEQNTDGDFIIINGDTLYKYIGNDENVVIPDNITNVCFRAFIDSKIKTAVIPSGVKHIDSAFEYSTIEKLDIPDTVEDTVFSFQNCTNLKEISLPESAEDIYFEDCISLEKVNIPESVGTISSSAFKDCRSLKEITLPEGITEIGRSAFKNSGLEKINIPASVACIGEETFEGTPFIEKLLEAPGDFIIINDIMLYCYKGESYDMIVPDGTEIICDGAVPKNIETVSLPEGVRYIGSAFRECWNITNISLPDSIAADDEMSFYKCSKLSEIKLPAGMTFVKDAAFKECKSLKKIELPQGLTEIGESAFGECTSLERIVIPESVTYIGDYAFCGCTSLKEVVINGNPYIGRMAFDGCDSLAVIPQSMERNIQ